MPVKPKVNPRDDVDPAPSHATHRTTTIGKASCGKPQARSDRVPVSRVPARSRPNQGRIRWWERRTLPLRDPASARVHARGGDRRGRWWPGGDGHARRPGHAQSPQVRRLLARVHRRQEDWGSFWSEVTHSAHPPSSFCSLKPPSRPWVGPLLAYRAVSIAAIAVSAVLNREAGRPDHGERDPLRSSVRLYSACRPASRGRH